MVSREVRDAVHGLIELTPREWRIVDSPALQRLRGVQQLALTHLIYPGARHSRFEHSLGACHLAGRLAERLGLDPEGRQRVRAAALLHDVGHGPFSQVGEAVFEELTGQGHVHEKITAAIVRFHDPIRAADVDADWIAELLTETGYGEYGSAERNIVSGPVDVDKMDYLLRDSHFCGVDFGRFDLDKVIDAARLTQSGDVQQLAFHVSGVYAIEGLMLARYQMHRQVYGHKTRIATDKMLVRAMLLGVEEGLLPKDVFAPQTMDARFVDEYLQWDDHKTLAVLSAAEDSRAGEMIRALRARQLMKRVARFGLDDLVSYGFDEKSVERALSPGRDVIQRERGAAEQLVADALGVDPMWVAFHWDEPRLPRDEVSITTDCGNTLRKFTDLSNIFGGYANSGVARAVSVYIRPQSGADDVSSRERSTAQVAALSSLQVIARSR